MAMSIDGPGYRMLKLATVVMGVLIIAGTVTLVGLVVAGVPGQAPSASATPARLAEPEGSRIAGIAASDGRLLVHVTGGGLPDRVRVFSVRDLPSAGVELAPR